MRVTSRSAIREFVKKHANSESPLDKWYRLMKRHNFDSFVDLRRMFPSADQVGKLTVFNIGGNNFRLIAAIHYNRHRI